MFKKLVFVQPPSKAPDASKKGHNKFYEMKEGNDNTFTVSYGRVGGHISTRSYPMSKWNRTYRSKIRKGYIDITPTGTAQSISFDGISPKIAKLLDDLMRYSNNHVQNTYFVTGADVTIQDINIVQGYLDSALEILQKQGDLDAIADLLIQVYTRFPRKMENVAAHIPRSHDRARAILSDEIDTLATLRAQTQLQSSPVDTKNPLDEMGLVIKEYDGAKISIPHRSAYTIINKHTLKHFTRFLNGRSADFQGIHGSKNRNIWPIIQQGLRIRPSGAGSNGSLYGNGIYFTDDYRKAKQYTGNYLMLFDVYIGKQHIAKSTNRRLGLNTINGDSVLGNRGYNEYIIYRPEQCTIATLLEL